MTLANAPTPSVHLAPPRISIARSILESTDSVAVTVRHGGADHLLCVSVERSDLRSADVLLLTDPPMAEVPSVCDKAARRCRVAAVRALVAGDTARYRLLSAVEVALSNYGCGWADGLAEEAREEVMAV
ncbi:MAG TPA: hypothetical protein VFE42_05735 [Chloroflexota bacterium]|nr:hypothetical protein [Chloroflexota bacterium]